MAKRVFFSFDYLDVANFRVNVIRQHGMTKLSRQAAGFFDRSLWEKAKTEGDRSVKRLINSAISGTSVTCVLIGQETYQRRWVRYEIIRSLKKGSKIIGVHINSIAGRESRAKAAGPNPLDFLGITFSGSGLTATVYEVNNGEWHEYAEVDGSSSWRVAQPVANYRGQGLRLSDFLVTYDWVADDGYGNFSEWIE